MGDGCAQVDRPVEPLPKRPVGTNPLTHTHHKTWAQKNALYTRSVHRLPFGAVKLTLLDYANHLNDRMVEKRSQ
jgi:hypothetical protein